MCFAFPSLILRCGLLFDVASQTRKTRPRSSTAFDFDSGTDFDSNPTECGPTRFWMGGPGKRHGQRSGRAHRKLDSRSHSKARVSTLRRIALSTRHARSIQRPRVDFPAYSAVNSTSGPIGIRNCRVSGPTAKTEAKLRSTREEDSVSRHTLESDIEWDWVIDESRTGQPQRVTGSSVCKRSANEAPGPD
jgi:hypothetical protein